MCAAAQISAGPGEAARADRARCACCFLYAPLPSTRKKLGRWIPHPCRRLLPAWASTPAARFPGIGILACAWIRTRLSLALDAFVKAALDRSARFLQIRGRGCRVTRCVHPGTYRIGSTPMRTPARVAPGENLGSLRWTHTRAQLRACTCGPTVNPRTPQ